VNAARTVETPASDQFDVPATAAGASATATWTDASGGRTSVGADARGVAGETREDFSSSKGAFTEERFAGGRQLFAGLFAERSQDLGGGFHLVAGLRLDRREDSDGHMRNIGAADGALLLQDLYPDRLGTEASPSAGVTWQASPGLTFHLAGQRAFRQPTLNELYRPFRQGTTTTLANPALETEHADSAELGAALRRGPFSATLEGFAASLSNAVDNVTLAEGPGTFPLFGALAAGATGQERLNLGRVDTLGVQAGADWSLPGGLGLHLSLIDEEATVASAPVAPALVGKTLAEVPRWAAAAGMRWKPLGRLSFDLRVRWTGSQFDDDLNTLVLASACAVDASARLALTPYASLFAAVDNLADARIETALSTLGVFSVAPPRTARAGASLSW
jgi:outer membrane receptor protein involved in Fe transport